MAIMRLGKDSDQRSCRALCSTGQFIIIIIIIIPIILTTILRYFYFKLHVQML